MSEQEKFELYKKGVRSAINVIRMVFEEAENVGVERNKHITLEDVFKIINSVDSNFEKLTEKYNGSFD